MLFIWFDWWSVGNVQEHIGGGLVQGELEHGRGKIVPELNILL